MSLDRISCPSSRQPSHCVIIANGDRPTQKVAQRYARAADLLLAADGGARHALALGLTPDVVIGDMDSLNEQDQARLRAVGTRLLVHPPDKDETDLELALSYALEQGAASITVLGALGGRLDQLLANILLLTMPALAEREVRLVDGAQTAFVVRDAARLEGQVGDTVSLIPLRGDARGVTTGGLLYPLEDDVLPFGLGLGVSNEITATPVSIRLRQGLLLCVHLSRERLQEV